MAHAWRRASRSDEGDAGGRQALRSRRPRSRSRRRRPTTLGRGWSSAGRSPCRGRASAPSRAPAGSRWRCSSPRRWRSPAPRRRASGSWWCASRASRRWRWPSGSAARAGGPIAGAIAAVALLATTDWLRYLSAGNVEPLVVALVLGAIELHLRRPPRRGVPARRAGRAGAPRGVAPRRGLRPLHRADRASMVAARARRPGHVRPVDRARLAGVGRSAAYLPSGPHQRRAASACRGRAIPRSSSCAAPAASRRRRCGSARCAAWPSAGAPEIAPWPRSPSSRRHGPGPPSPRPLSATRRCPATSSCPWPSAVSWPGSARSPSCAWRPAPAAALCWRWPWSPSAPRSPSPAPTGCTTRAAEAKARAETLSALWRAVDRAQRRAPVARLHPVVQPGGLENGLAWKLDLHLDDVGRWFSPAVGIAFIDGDDAAVIARLRRRNATAVATHGRGPVACPARPVGLGAARRGRP